MIVGESLKRTSEGHVTDEIRVGRPPAITRLAARVRLRFHFVIFLLQICLYLMSNILLSHN